MALEHEDAPLRIGDRVVVGLDRVPATVTGFEPDMMRDGSAAVLARTDDGRDVWGHRSTFQNRPCRHQESLYGRCVACGMTWEEQEEARANG
jgi:hypothetical protein